MSTNLSPILRDHIPTPSNRLVDCHPAGTLRNCELVLAVLETARPDEIGIDDEEGMAHALILKTVRDALEHARLSLND